MTLRTDSITGHSEPFGYDGMNRLTCGGEDSYAYDTRGNVTHRSGVGAYTYSSAAPYAVSEVPFSAMVPQREQHIAFGALQQPDSISEGGAVATFTYGADLQRSAMRITRKDGSELSVRYHDGGAHTGFDRLSAGGAKRHKDVLWIGGDPYTAPAAMVRDYGSGHWQPRIVVRDCLGSVVAVTDTAGTVLERDNYDPWGVRRDPLTQQPYASGEEPELLLGRGYCGHEHLPDFGLVNMNARLYDPALCRFLSPDPMVQAPDNSQSFNRYSYCLNNPLKFIDRTGMNAYYSKNGQIVYSLPKLEGERHLGLYGVVVTAEPLTSILPCGVNHYTPQDPGEWLQYYGSQQDIWGGRGNGDPFDINQGGYSSTSDGLGVTTKISIINTAVSFPVNTINQWWKYVRDDEERQIAVLQQRLSSAPSAETERLLQSKAAQYETIAKSTKALKYINRGLIGVGAVITLYGFIQDVSEKKVAKGSARLAVGTLTILSGFIPVVGPFVSVGLGIADAVWGEEFYNWIEK